VEGRKGRKREREKNFKLYNSFPAQCYDFVLAPSSQYRNMVEWRRKCLF
jgi:hypothetical protein